MIPKTLLSLLILTVFRSRKFVFVLFFAFLQNNPGSPDKLNILNLNFEIYEFAGKISFFQSI